MSLIKVTAEDLHSLSGHVRTGSGSIQEQMSRLQNEVASVVGGEWMGNASGAFNVKYEEWNRGAIMIKEALDGIASLLTGAAVQYQMTEDHVRGTMV